MSGDAGLSLMVGVVADVMVDVMADVVVNAEGDSGDGVAGDEVLRLTGTMPVSEVGTVLGGGLVGTLSLFLSSADSMFFIT